jgi:hypothetical protein
MLMKTQQLSENSRKCRWLRQFTKPLKILKLATKFGNGENWKPSRTLNVNEKTAP